MENEIVSSDHFLRICKASHESTFSTYHLSESVLVFPFSLAFSFTSIIHSFVYLSCYRADRAHEACTPFSLWVFRPLCLRHYASQSLGGSASSELNVSGVWLNGNRSSLSTSAAFAMMTIPMSPSSIGSLIQHPTAARFWVFRTSPAQSLEYHERECDSCVIHTVKVTKASQHHDHRVSHLCHPNGHGYCSRRNHLLHSFCPFGHQSAE